jgi:hypothetical protein
MTDFHRNGQCLKLCCLNFLLPRLKCLTFDAKHVHIMGYEVISLLLKSKLRNRLQIIITEITPYNNKLIANMNPVILAYIRVAAITGTN